MKNAKCEAGETPAMEAKAHSKSFIKLASKAADKIKNAKGKKK